MRLKKVGGFSLGTLLSRLSGMGREIVFAYLFGSSASMDAFRIAFNIPNLLRDFFGEGGMNAAFLPVYSSYRSKKGERSANRYLSSFLLPLIIALLVVVSLGILFSPQIISVVARGFIDNPIQFNLAIHLMRIIFPFLLFISLASVIMGVLTYFDRFFITGVYPVFFNLSVILFSFLLYQKFGIIGVAIGVMVGGILQFLFLTFFLPGEGVRLFKPVWGHPGVLTSIRLIGPVFLAYAATRINVTVTLFLASLLPTGSISYLSYAYRIMQLPLGMFGVAVATVALPELSRKFAKMESQETLILSSLRAVFLLSIPSSFLLFSLRIPLIRILYEHGAFSTMDSLRTASVLLFYVIGIPFIAGTKVIQNVYFSRRDVKTPMRISYITMIINILFAIILMNIMDEKGLALAVSIGGIFQFFLLIKPYFNMLKKIFIFLFKLILCSTLAILPVIYIEQIFISFISLIIGSIIFGLIFIGSAYILRIEEICQILKR
ncbi:murein biosynthesis integral membrane protein MurJ [candidate division WOR-3 bacterium]|nr:murein biosynthesis integral membrane protein MurJ [candidate division WOR-3 bacterium]